MKSTYLLLCTFLSLFIISCEQDEESEITVEPEVQALTNANGWKVDSAFFQVPYPINDSMSTLNFLEVIPECILDDITYYNSDKSWSVEDHIDDCDENPENNTKGEGIWYFNASKDILYLTRPRFFNDTVQSRIIKLETNSFIYTGNSNFYGVDYEIILYSSLAN